jgi:sirohydrochlorin ferrochelatase
MGTLAVCCVLVAATTAAREQPVRDGILVLAHGGRPEWNERLMALVARVNERQPAAAAFGMASRSAMEAAIGRLVSRGVTRIVAVPLFVSSHSAVITSTEYLLGLRGEAPPELAFLARMDHSQHGGGGSHAAHGDPTAPLAKTVPVRMTAALDRHPVVADILVTRIRAISRDPGREVVVLVAHGPSRDDENARWLEDLAVTAGRVGAAMPFRRVEYLTVRDDAPAAVRDAATAELRAVVGRHARDGARVLIAPVVMSFGGIEQGIRKRLEGLDIVMTDQGLMPDDRLVEWVLAMAAPPDIR